MSERLTNIRGGIVQDGAGLHALHLHHTRRLPHISFRSLSLYSINNDDMWYVSPSVNVQIFMLNNSDFQKITLVNNRWHMARTTEIFFSLDIVMIDSNFIVTYSRINIDWLYRAAENRISYKFSNDKIPKRYNVPKL